MTSREHLSRCRVCGTVPKRIFVRVVQFSYLDGWRKRDVLCQPCAKFLFRAIAVARGVAA